jgi:hypothetical protein
MPKVAASFNDQQHADAVVSELGRLNIDGLDWRVQQPGDGATGTVPVVGIPANTGGTGMGTAGGSSAIAAPFFAAGADDLGAGEGDEDDYLRQARSRGAIVIVVDAPSGAEDTVQEIFSRHDAANMTVS